MAVIACLVIIVDPLLYVDYDEQIHVRSIYFSTDVPL